MCVFGAPATIVRVSEKFRRLSESDDVVSISKLVYWAGGRARIEFHPRQNSIIKPVVYLKRIRSLLQYDPEALPFSGACRAPSPTEAEVARYRKLQKDLVTRFSGSVLVQAEAVHSQMMDCGGMRVWRKQQEDAVHAARKKEEQKLLSQKVCILRHDEDLTGASRIDKAVGEDPAAAAAAAATAAAAALSCGADPAAAEGQGQATAAAAAAAAALTEAAAAATGVALVVVAATLAVVFLAGAGRQAAAAAAATAAATDRCSITGQQRMPHEREAVLSVAAALCYDSAGSVGTIHDRV
ncbi:hypothetical protein Emag_005200 [Eimeria magna]